MYVLIYIHKYILLKNVVLHVYAYTNIFVYANI